MLYVLRCNICQCLCVDKYIYVISNIIYICMNIKEIIICFIYFWGGPGLADILNNVMYLHTQKYFQSNVMKYISPCNNVTAKC